MNASTPRSADLVVVAAVHGGNSPASRRDGGHHNGEIVKDVQ